MSVVAVIPARYASTRFPAKMLASETGKPLVQHVVEQARAAKRLDRVIIATDDERIAAAVRSFDGEVMMTREDHVSGTDRVAEVAARVKADFILNVQGDEPEMDPGNIDRLVELMQSGDHEIGTVACHFAPDAPTSGVGSPADPNCVKLVRNARGEALYFSRALVPFPRDLKGNPTPPSNWLLHLGLYAFKPDTLGKLATLEPTELEITERLEQLRWLYNGYSIAVAIGTKPSGGIDTPEDYAAFVARHRAAQ